MDFDNTQTGLTADDYGNMLALGLEELLTGVERAGGTKYAWRALAYGYDQLSWELQETAEDSLLKYVPHARGLSNALSSQRDDALILLQTIPLFAGIPDPELTKLSRALIAQRFEREERIVPPPGMQGSFFIVRAGRAELLNPEGVRTTVLARGDHFDGSALSSKQKGITARALTPLEVLFLDAAHLQQVTASNPNLDGKARVKIKRMGLLRSIPLFEEFEADELEALASKLKTRRYMPGESVFEQGDAGRAFYIIESGKVSVQIDGQEQARLSAGEYFGEIALFHDTPRVATVMALEDSSLLELNGEEFDRLTAASVEMRRAVERASSRRVLANERRKAHTNGRQVAPYA